MDGQDHLRQQILQLEQLVRPLLTRDALERLGNVKIAHPEMYVHALTIIGQYGKSVDDGQLREILKKISPHSRFKIRYR